MCRCASGVLERERTRRKRPQKQRYPPDGGIPFLPVNRQKRGLAQPACDTNPEESASVGRTLPCVPCVSVCANCTASQGCKRTCRPPGSGRPLPGFQCPTEERTPRKGAPLLAYIKMPKKGLTCTKLVICNCNLGGNRYLPGYINIK